MKEEAQKFVVETGKEYATEILEWIKSSKEFAVEQLPIFAKEFLMWGYAYHLSLVLMGIVFTVASILFWLFIFPKFSKLSFNPDLEAMIIVLAGVGLPAAGLFITIGNLYWIAFIYMAPRIYIVTEMAKMIKDDH